MSSYYDLVKHNVEKGIKGENKGIPIKLERLKIVMPNIQKGTFYLVASDSGVGKSAWSSYLFIFTPFFEWLKCNGEYDIDINLYTGEMPVDYMVGQMICHWMYLMDKEILISPTQLFSYGEKKLSKKILDVFNSKECEDIVNVFQSKVNIVNQAISSGFIYKEVYRLANKHGIINTVPITINNESYNSVVSYKENNSKLHTICIVDNFNLLSRSNSAKMPEISAKDSIDNTSSYMNYGRLHFNQIWVGLQQINRNTKNLDRYKLGEFFPGSESLKGSEQPFHDCQVCNILINPHHLKLPDFAEYRIESNSKKGLEDRAVFMRIIKNRTGVTGKIIPLFFLGENSYYTELPATKDMDQYYDYLYDKYIKK
jgi:hypothetical protein